MPAGPTQEIKGARWVVVTGLVPIEKQLKAYADAFRAAAGYEASRDYPMYRDYQIQRVEVSDPSADVSAINWDNAPTSSFQQERDKTIIEWSTTGGMAEIVNPTFVDYHLVYPLGPLTGRTWADRSLADTVAHAPEIPVLKPEEWGTRGGGPMMPGPMMPGPMMPGPMMPGRRSPMPGPSMPGPSGGPGEDTPFGPSGGPSTPGSPLVPGYGGYPGTTPENKPLEYLLLRYFDFKVEPGKHYVYRVRLWLPNPNYISETDAATGSLYNTGLRPGCLKDLNLAKEKWLTTGWSAPSPVITVPHNERVLAATATTRSREASAAITIAKWIQRKGIEASKEFSLIRGQIANFREDVFTPGNGTAMPGYGGGAPPQPGARGAGRDAGRGGRGGQGKRRGAAEDREWDQECREWDQECRAWGRGCRRAWDRGCRADGRGCRELAAAEWDAVRSTLGPGLSRSTISLTRLPSTSVEARWSLIEGPPAASGSR